MKFQNGLRGLVIIENGEICLVQIAHKLAVLVCGNKKDVNFVYPLLNGENRVLTGLLAIRVSKRYTAGYGVGAGQSRLRPDVRIRLAGYRRAGRNQKDHERKHEPYVLHSKEVQNLPD